LGAATSPHAARIAKIEGATSNDGVRSFRMRSVA
jgi:hypothetical protein